MKERISELLYEISRRKEEDQLQISLEPYSFLCDCEKETYRIKADELIHILTAEGWQSPERHECDNCAKEIPDEWDVRDRCPSCREIWDVRDGE